MQFQTYNCFERKICFIFMGLCLRNKLCACEYRCLWNLHVEFHGAEVAGGYELLHMGARIQTLPMQDHWVFVLFSFLPFLNVGFLF